MQPPQWHRGRTRDGGAAEFVLVPEDNAIRLPESLATLDASLVEPLACAVHGLDSLGSVTGNHALVYGAGPMGLDPDPVAGRFWSRIGHGPGPGARQGTGRRALRGHGHRHEQA